MKVCIIIATAEQAKTAGVRIRYERLMSRRDSSGLAIMVRPIAELIQSQSFDIADVYIFSKVQTGLAAVLMHRLQQSGALVGVDIFDDYFTQRGDTRVEHHRRWLAKCGPAFDFMLCSTTRLQAILEHAFPGKPILMISDPAPACEIRDVWMLAGEKLERAIASRVLDVLWFGIATNPYYPVGIHDLVAYGEELAGLRRDGWSPRLTILTNFNTLHTRDLVRLARLPIPYELIEWSAEREAALLQSAFLCFLPVNGQEFSRAKSLNRAISALSAGCQILSNGYPLYAVMSDFVYTSSAEIIRDLKSGTMRLRPETAAKVAEILLAHGNSHAAADALWRFLAIQLAARSPDQAEARSPGGKGGRKFPIDIGLIQGASHDAGAHKLASQLGAVSIKSPFTQADLKFDVRFDAEIVKEPIAIFVQENLLDRVASGFKGDFKRHGPVGKQGMWRLAPDTARTVLGLERPASLEVPSPFGEICAYTKTMHSVITACNRLFPDFRIFVSESANLRFH